MYAEYMLSHNYNYGKVEESVKMLEYERKGEE